MLELNNIAIYGLKSRYVQKVEVIELLKDDGTNPNPNPKPLL